MKIVILQTDIVWANPSANIEKADEIINRYEGVDIFVLPEMFSTGFCTNPEGIAEKSDSKTLEWMKHTAQRTAQEMCYCRQYSVGGKRSVL